MILTIEPQRSAGPRGRPAPEVKTPQLFLAVRSTPSAEVSFSWPEWLSPASESHGGGSLQLIPLTTVRRSRNK